MLKEYHHSMLQYAFEGKLTEKWRKNNPDKVDPHSLKK